MENIKHNPQIIIKKTENEEEDFIKYGLGLDQKDTIIQERNPVVKTIVYTSLATDFLCE